jgi:hypothetical protein
MAGDGAAVFFGRLGFILDLLVVRRGEGSIALLR